MFRRILTAAICATFALAPMVPDSDACCLLKRLRRNRTSAVPPGAALNTPEDVAARVQELVGILSKPLKPLPELPDDVAELLGLGAEEEPEESSDPEAPDSSNPGNSNEADPGAPPNNQPQADEVRSVVPAMRQWTDNTGRYHTQARLVKVLDGEVRLLKENCETATVPLARLSEADRRYVEANTADLSLAQRANN